MLDGIPPAPRGVPQVEVSFDIDANGILHVKAKDKATNKEQSIRIEASSGLSKEEIERMKQDAQVHAEEDKKKREAVETKNVTDTLLYTAEKTKKEFSDKMKEEVKKELDEKIDALTKVKDGGDTDAIKKASEELSQTLQKIGAEMYQQKGADAPQGEAAAENAEKEKEGPVEGEFEEGK